MCVCVHVLVNSPELQTEPMIAQALMTIVVLRNTQNTLALDGVQERIAISYCPLDDSYLSPNYNATSALDRNIAYAPTEY